MNRTKILEEIQKNVELLSTTGLEAYKYIPLHQKPSPSVTALREIMNLLRKVIFPGFFGTEQEAQTDSIQYYTGVYLEQAYDLNKSIMACALRSNVVVIPKIVLLK